MTNDNPSGLPVAWISSRQLHGVREADNPTQPRSVMLSRDFTRNRRIGLVTDTDYAALLAERDALRADAERYRWLRHGDNDESVIRGPVKDGAYLLRNDKLDAAIDAAMAAEGRE